MKDMQVSRLLFLIFLVNSTLLQAQTASDEDINDTR
jgi:hypothetical protein